MDRFIKRQERIAFRLKLETSTMAVVEAYGHVRAIVVNADDGHGVRDGFQDSGSGKWGHVEPLERFEVNCQFQRGDTPYAWRVCYRDIYVADVTDCEHMARTLRRIETALQKLTDDYGAPATFGQYVQRVAKIIGISAVITSDLKLPDGYMDSYETRRGPSDIAWLADRLVWQWQAEHGAEVPA